MAKEKEEKALNQYEAMLSSVDTLVQNPPKVISVSPKLDIALGGGITEGCLVILTGPEKVGKTVTALSIAKNAQKVAVDEDKDIVRKIYYGNIEGRIKIRDIQGIRNLITDPSHFEFVASKKGLILSGQDYLSFFEYMVNQMPYCIGIVDSFSSLISKEEMINELSDVEVAAMQRILARFTKRISNVLPINRNVIIGITHLMANIKKFGMGKEKTEKSGNALKYAQDIKLYATHKTPIKKGETQIGQTVHWIIENSALGMPGQSVDSHIKYGVGIWESYELAELCRDYGIITGKAWLTMPNGEKINGLGGVAELLDSEPTLFAELKQRTLEMCGLAK